MGGRKGKVQVSKKERFSSLCHWNVGLGSVTIAASCGSMLQQSQESLLASLLGHLDVSRTLSTCEGSKPTQDLLASLSTKEKHAICQSKTKTASTVEQTKYLCKGPLLH